MIKKESSRLGRSRSEQSGSSIFACAASTGNAVSFEQWAEIWRSLHERAAFFGCMQFEGLALERFSPSRTAERPPKTRGVGFEIIREIITCPAWAAS